MTIYLDERTLKDVQRAARRARVSVSSWVKDRLVGGLEKEWPPNYFAVFGRLAERDLERPDQGRLEDDSPREPL
ncbi:MAG: toxin-antitoxin system, antitoxin component [Planctomycetes bacterium]|nr:toxin-antitoxin system, antitoxin component [Planctomycetota bacterium]